MTQNASSTSLSIDTEKLSGLLAELRGVAEIPIGIGEEIALVRLLSELIAQGALNSLEDVRGYIAPLLTRSEADRKLFDQAFGRWFGLAPPEKPTPGQPGKAKPEGRKSERPELRALIPGWINRAWPWVFGTFVVVYAATLLGPPEVEQPIAADPFPATPRCTVETPEYCPTESAPIVTGFDRLPVSQRISIVVDGSFGHCARPNIPFDSTDPEDYIAFAGAPTLAELTWMTGDFADPAISNVGLRCWNVEVADPTNAYSLANAIGQISGLPVNRPLPVAYDAETAGRIAYAIGVLSDDPNLAPLSAYVAAARENVAVSQSSVETWAPMMDSSGSGLASELDVVEFNLREAVARFGDGDIATGAELHISRRIAALYAAIYGRSYSELPGVYLDNPIWRAGGIDYDETTAEHAFWYKSIRPGLFVAFLLLLALWMANGLDRRKAFLRRRRPLYPPSIHTFVTSVARATPFSSNALRRTIQTLQQWTSRQSDRLDIDKTLDKTLNEGVFSPVRAEVKGLPEYLVLIETRGNGDQETQRLRALVRRLEDAHILVSVYYYEGNPFWCRAETGDLKDGANPLAGAIHTIDELKMRYPDHRLIVLGEGETFVDPVTEIASRGARGLMDWDERAMLTPTALRSWGSREFTIAQSLKLPLGRATEDGTAALPALLGLDGRERPLLYSETGDGFARSLPMLVETRAERWLGDAPVTERDWERLDQALRSYLDPVGYIWLSACAVYPELRWDLTLYLGQSVRTGNDQPFFSEARLADLLKLPWLRAGRMPDWLRAKLIEGLAPETAKQVRRLLRRLIDDATEGDSASDEDALRLRIATEEPGEELPLQDTVFLDFLVGGQTTDLELDRNEDKDQRTARRGKGSGDQISKMLWKAGLLWGVVLLAVLPFGGQLGLLDRVNPIDMIYDGNVWGRFLFLTFAALFAAALSLFIIDPSSVTYRRWHSFSAICMSAIVGTIIVLGILLLTDGPLWIVWEPFLDYIDTIEGDSPLMKWLFGNEEIWISILVAIVAFVLHLVLYPLGARLGVLPPSQEVSIGRRVLGSFVTLPLTLPVTFGVAVYIIAGAESMSGTGDRIGENIWAWAELAHWPAILFVIATWLVIMRGLVGLARRWRRLAMHPPAPVNRRGHRLMTTSIILRIAGAYLAGSILFFVPVVTDVIFDGLLDGVIINGLLDSLFPDADSDFNNLIGLVLALCVYLSPGVFYAWWLDRRQSPDIGVSFDFRGRGKAFMVALGRATAAALIGGTLALFTILLILSPGGIEQFEAVAFGGLCALALFELAARFFSNRARKHRQTQPRRLRAQNAFGPAWLKWTGVGAVTASTFAGWYLVMATIPPGQRLGPAGATSIALNEWQSLALANEAGVIHFWDDRDFGFAQTLDVGAALDGLHDPIVHVALDPDIGLDGCVVWQRQSGALEIRSPSGDLRRLDTSPESGGRLQIAVSRSALIMTEIVSEVSATAEPAEPAPASNAADAYVMTFVSCDTGEQVDELLDFSGRVPTALSISRDDPIVLARGEGVVSGTYHVGFSNGWTSTISMPVYDSVDETPGSDGPIVGFTASGRPISIPVIGQQYVEGLQDDVYWLDQNIRSLEEEANRIDELAAQQRAAGITGPDYDKLQQEADQTRSELLDLEMQREQLLEQLMQGEPVVLQDQNSALSDMFDTIETELDSSGADITEELVPPEETQDAIEQKQIEQTTSTTPTRPRTTKEPAK